MKNGNGKIAYKKEVVSRKSKSTTKKFLVKNSKKSAFKEDAKSIVKKTRDFITSKVLSKTSKKNKSKNIPKSKALQYNEDECKKIKNSKAEIETQISFFYTNDKYFTQLDDKEIIAFIQQKYPEFMRDGVSDTILKHIIVDMIEDKKFIDTLLEFFSINIQEFFKIIFRCDISIFKGQYLNKVQKILQANGYDV